MLHAATQPRKRLALQNLLHLGQAKAHALVVLGVPQQVDLPVIVVAIAVGGVHLGLNDAPLLVKAQGVARKTKPLADVLLRIAHVTPPLSARPTAYKAQCHAFALTWG